MCYLQKNLDPTAKSGYILTMKKGVYEQFLEGDVSPLVKDLKFVSQLSNVSVATKAEMLGVEVGEYLEYLWHVNLVPAFSENDTVRRVIDRAVLGVGDMPESARDRLVAYRSTRKEKFFESVEDLQSIYELYLEGLSDFDISEIVGVQEHCVFVFTGLFRDPRHSLGD